MPSSVDQMWYLSIAIAGVCTIAVVYPYVLYPAILLTLPKKPVDRGAPDAGTGAKFALLFCAYNEAAAMPAKLANLKELKVRYPDVAVLAFDDGSDDGTPEMIEREAPFIHLVRGGGRKGKAHGMKLLAAAADREFLVFTDANVLLDQSALDALAACYADSTVGGVCGALRYLGTDESSTASVGGLYWRLEEKIKDLESATGDVMGADGSIFSIRRELYPDFPDTVLDDFTVSMETVFRGYRLIKSNNVIAYERLVTARSDEFSRKIRIASRAFSTHTYLREKRRSLSHGNRFKYMSHKTIRWFGGLFLIVGTVAAATALILLSPWVAAATLAALIAVLTLGFLTTKGLASSCAEIVIAMIATLIGVGRALRGQSTVTWNPAKSRE